MNYPEVLGFFRTLFIIMTLILTFLKTWILYNNVLFSASLFKCKRNKTVASANINADIDTGDDVEVFPFKAT